MAPKKKAVEVDQAADLIPILDAEPDPYFEDPDYNPENDDADLNDKQPPGPVEQDPEK